MRLLPLTSCKLAPPAPLRTFGPHEKMGTALIPTLLPLDSRRRRTAGLTTVALGLFPQSSEEQDGRSFFCSACYDKGVDEEVTLSCKCLSLREEDNHTSTVAHVITGIKI
jgi:hypothetical protein